MRFILRGGLSYEIREKKGRFLYKSREKHEGGVWKILNYWVGRASYIIRDKIQGGSLEVTFGRFIQDITAERHYWR